MNSAWIDCQSTVDGNIGLRILCLMRTLMQGYFKVASKLHFVLDCKSNPAPIICCISRWPVTNDNQWNLQNALPVKLHSWSVEGFFERSFVHTCSVALDCSTLVSPKGCVSVPLRGRVHLNSDWINSSMSFRVSSQSQSNCMGLIWKAGLCELLWDPWKGVSRMNQFRRSNGWSMDWATFWGEFIPGAFVQRLLIIMISGGRLQDFRGRVPRWFVLEATLAHNVRSYSLYLVSEQL